jgi:hypothetical protein
MAYIYGTFQGKATNIKILQTQRGKRKIELNFILVDQDNNKELKINVLLLSKSENVKEGEIIRIEGKLELNSWGNNNNLRIITSKLLPIENPTKNEEGTLTGIFNGFPKFIEEKQTNTGKRKINFSLLLSNQTDDGEWINRNIYTTILNEDILLTENSPIKINGKLTYNTWINDNDIEVDNLKLFSFNILN